MTYPRFIFIKNPNMRFSVKRAFPHWQSAVTRAFSPPRLVSSKLTLLDSHFRRTEVAHRTKTASVSALYSTAEI